LEVNTCSFDISYIIFHIPNVHGYSLQIASEIANDLIQYLLPMNNHKVDQYLKLWNINCMFISNYPKMALLITDLVEGTWQDFIFREVQKELFFNKIHH